MHMDTVDIERVLESSIHGARKADQLKREASDQDLVAALQRVTDLNMWHVLHYVIGERKIQAALPVLLEHLTHPHADIRDSAADALGKIGDPQAGDALFARFTGAEPEPGVRPMLAAALGGVGYRPAIPALIATLQTPGSEATMLRRMAAEALRTLKAVEALPALEQAWAQERNAYTKDRMLLAIGVIQNALL
jgi:HEAT repeat protein